MLFEYFLYISPTFPNKYQCLVFSTRLTHSVVNPLDPELYQIQSASTNHQPELGDNNVSGWPLLLGFPLVFR